MTVQHVVQALDAEGFVSASQKLVLIELAYRADRKGIIRSSQSEIAASTILSRRTVAQWFAEFEATGILEREGHGRYKWSVDGDISGLLKPVDRVRARPGAMEEQKRLQGIMGADDAIYWSADGWPTLGKYRE